MQARTLPVSFLTAGMVSIRIFYREAGNPGTPAVLLLHGFPTASHMLCNKA